MIPMTHPSPQPKWRVDQFSRFCTDDRRVSLLFTIGRPFPLLELQPPIGGSGLLSNTVHGFLGRPELKQHFDRCSRVCRAH